MNLKDYAAAMTVWRRLKADPKMDPRLSLDLAWTMFKVCPADDSAAELLTYMISEKDSGIRDWLPQLAGLVLLRMVRPDGDVRIVVVKGQPEIVDGKAVALLGIMTDVTEAMATLGAMQDQHDMLDLAADLAQLGHWVWAADKSITSPSRHPSRYAATIAGLRLMSAARGVRNGLPTAIARQRPQ